MTTWTAQILYSAPEAAPTDLATFVADHAATVDADNPELVAVCRDVDAETLAQATVTALDLPVPAGFTARQVRLLPAADYLHERAYPPAQDLIGQVESAAVLGVSRQRLNVLRHHRDFPPPVAHPSCGPVYTRVSIDEFYLRWAPTRPSPRQD